MMSLCKTVHTLFGSTDAADGRNPPHRCRKILSTDGGGLRLVAVDPPKPPNVVESSAVGPAGKPPEKVDPGARGLFEQNDDRLGLCTEGLGCESCDEWVGMDEAEVAAETEEGRRSRRKGARSWRRREEASFPPPLPWLAGRQITFLRPVRRDGRFVLTEVRIERPAIFRASRQDGRLRLEVIRSEDVTKEDLAEAAVVEEEEVEEKEDPAPVEEVEMEARGGGGGGGEGKEEEMSGAWEWRRGRRCHEAVSGKGIPMWSNHRFVTTA